MLDLEQAVRDRLWHDLNPQTASLINLNVHQLQQICAGALRLSPDQIATLARHYRFAMEAVS